MDASTQIIRGRREDESFYYYIPHDPYTYPEHIILFRSVYKERFVVVSRAREVVVVSSSKNEHESFYENFQALW